MSASCTPLCWSSVGPSASPAPRSAKRRSASWRSPRERRAQGAHRRAPDGVDHRVRARGLGHDRVDPAARGRVAPGSDFRTMRPLRGAVATALAGRRRAGGRCGFEEHVRRGECCRELRGRTAREPYARQRRPGAARPRDDPRQVLPQIREHGRVIQTSLGDRSKHSSQRRWPRRAPDETRSGGGATPGLVLIGDQLRAASSAS